jgi:MurNAc alpha-1-phosphate uridylyltransferase
VCDERLFRDSPDGAFSLLHLWTRAEADGRLFGLVHDGKWFHVGTAQALAEAERLLA